MKQLHLLNGDALLEKLSGLHLKGNYIVCRECLMEGPVNTTAGKKFWEDRSDFISDSFSVKPEEYWQKSFSEFHKLEMLSEPHEINLWFEDDLFCQVNYWFCIQFIRQLNAGHVMFRVFPTSHLGDPGWSGFGRLEQGELEICLAQRIKLNDNDIEIGVNLWQAFATANDSVLKHHSNLSSDAFRHLDEVIAAHLDRATQPNRPGRPQRTLLEVLSGGNKTFAQIFAEFSSREGVYGFGDLQVKKLLSTLNA